MDNGKCHFTKGHHVKKMADLKPLTLNDIRTSPDYLDIFKLAFGPFTEKKLEMVLSGYETNRNAKIYGLLKQGKIVGILGYELKDDQLIINQIAIAGKEQGMGYGKEIVDQIINLEMPLQIQAETDDDAVEFYEKLGFSCSPFVSEYGNKRYKCTLNRKGK